MAILAFFLNHLLACCSFLPTGAEAKPAGDSNGFTRFLDAAQWLLGGGARIESKAITPKKKKSEEKKVGSKGGKASVAVEKK